MVKSIGSDYLQTAETSNGNENFAVPTGFKKIKKTTLLKKRQADEDIVTLLE